MQHGGLILTAPVDGTAKVWRTDTGECTTTLQGHRGLVTSAVFNPDGGLILTASRDRTAKVWGAWWGRRLDELLS